MKTGILYAALLLSPVIANADNVTIGPDGSINVENQYGEKTSVSASGGVATQDRYGQTSTVTPNGIVSKDRYGTTTTINHPSVSAVQKPVVANPYIPPAPATTTVIAPGYIKKTDSLGNASVTTPGHIVTHDAMGNTTDVNGVTGTITKTYASPATGQTTVIQTQQNDPAASNNNVNINASGVHIDDTNGNHVRIGQ